MKKKLDVVLSKDLWGKGSIGDIIKVALGYARNYLLPNGIAKVASAQTIKEAEMRKQTIAFRLEKEKEQAQKIANEINGQSVDVYAKVGESGKLFGSVTSQDVAGALSGKFNVDVDKRNVSLVLVDGEESKTIDVCGAYEYEIKLFQGVHAKITVNVKSDDEKVN